MGWRFQSGRPHFQSGGPGAGSLFQAGGPSACSRFQSGGPGAGPRFLSGGTVRAAEAKVRIAIPVSFIVVKGGSKAAEISIRFLVKEVIVEVVMDKRL